MTLKKLTYRFLIILVLVIAADRGFGWYLDSCYEANHCDYDNGRLNVFLEKERCDTLFIGSSRVLHTINPEYLGPNSSVLAFQNRNICHNVALFDLIAQKKKHPKKVLIFNLDLDDLFHESDRELLEKVLHLKYYYPQNTFIRDLIHRLGFQERIKFLSSTYRHNGFGWKLLAFPANGNCSEVPKNGYAPLYPTPNDSLRLKKSLEEDFTGFDYTYKSKLTYEMIDHLITRCKKTGTELILINTPYYTYPDEWQQISAQFKNHCERKGVRFVDFNNHRLALLSDAQFWYDNMHMNDQGATEFTKHLKSVFY